MKKVVERERNKIYYRVLHLPVWIWVFFVLPGRLTHDLYSHGPDRRHGIWLLLVTVGCVWRGIAGRLPGVETQPYVTHFGVHQPNLWYRVVCYTAAWIDLLVPFTLNFLGRVLAAISSRWKKLWDRNLRFVHPQDCQEGFLWDIDFADTLHAAFSGLLLFQ